MLQESRLIGGHFVTSGQHLCPEGNQLEKPIMLLSFSTASNLSYLA
jgi:hypothetical protein